MATQTLRQTEQTPARSATRWRLGLVVGGVVLLLIGAGAALAKWVDESARIRPDVKVAGLAVGGMKRAEAEQAIQQQFAAVLDTPLELRLGTRTWTYAARALGVSLDSAATANAAYAAGRDGADPAALEVPLTFAHAREQAAGTLAALAKALAVAPVDARLDVAADGIAVHPAKDGQRLDDDATWEAIVAATTRQPFGTPAVTVAPITPAVVDADVTAPAALAHRLTDAPLVFTATIDSEVLTQTLDAPTLRGMLQVSKDAQGKPTVAEELDRAQLEAVVQKLAPGIAREAVNARLELPDFQTKMVLHPAVDARELDIATTVRRAQAAALVSGAGRTVPLAVVETPATVQGALLKPLQDKLDKVMRDGVTLRYGSQSYHVKGERLALFIYVTPGEDGLPETYKVTISDEDMQRLAQAIAKELYEPAREVRYRQVDGKITLVQAPKEGLEVEVAPTAANLKAATLAGAAQADMVWRPVRPTSAEVDPATIQTPDLLATGQTYYGASSAERNWNVTFGASKLDGWYIPPGETFSVNEALGDLTLEAGFKMGWAILVESGNATTIPSEAGGICQVSTTLFHSVFRAGLPVSEYHHHSYWIATYGRAPSGMQGLDSTISPPWSDLKFRNNTGNWVLIRSKGDTQNLTIQLYGTDPGWDVQIKAPVISDVVKTDPRLRRETSDKLPAGKIVKVETAQDGFTSTIERTVVKDGKVVDQWTIKNTYLPAHNVEVVGTGKDVATPGPSPTATPKP